MLSRISIILVEPENPDNIGAVARAMKNMGLSDLRLVRPPANWKRKGKKMAMSAYDLLRQAKACKTLEQAVKDAHHVVGTSRRLGPRRGQFKDLEPGIAEIYQEAVSGRGTAILFGKESKGLDNASIEKCDWMITIPSSDLYPSLNLAQAVMVTAFSLYQKSFSKPQKPLNREVFFCEKQEIEDALTHFKRALEALEYGKGRGLLDRVLATTRGIFKRNGMLEEEAQMIKGLSRTIVLKLKKSEAISAKDDTIFKT